MKKCTGCHQEIDKYVIACEYCGKLLKEHEKSEKDNNPEFDPLAEKNKKDAGTEPSKEE